MVTIEIFPEKHKEFIQASSSMHEDFKKEKGFRSFALFQDVHDSNRFNMIQEWETQDDLNTFTRSANFQVLMGALKVLARHSKIEYNLVSDEPGRKILG